jgi:protein TonB
MPERNGSALSPVTPPLPPPAKSQHPKRIRVSGREESPRLIFHPTPEYPPLWDGQVIKGLVRLDAVIGADGKVQELKAISGSPLLIKAAMGAVKNWRYQPTLVNGEAVEVATEIDINFTIAD